MSVLEQRECQSCGSKDVNIFNLNIWLCDDCQNRKRVLGRKRKTLITDKDGCPRCDYSDKHIPLHKGSQITKNILDSFRRETNYTDEQLENATHWCERCNIVYQVEIEN